MLFDPGLQHLQHIGKIGGVVGDVLMEDLEELLEDDEAYTLDSDIAVPVDCEDVGIDCGVMLEGIVIGDKL